MNELKIKAKDENLSQVLELIDGMLEQNDCSMKVQMQIDIAVEEIFVNVSHYAYAPDEGDVLIKYGIENGEVEITVIDSGAPYNPLEKPDPDITLSVDERQIGGLGIFMVKKIMDSVSYQYVDNRNNFTIRKKMLLQSG